MASKIAWEKYAYVDGGVSGDSGGVSGDSGGGDGDGVDGVHHPIIGTLFIIPNTTNKSKTLCRSITFKTESYYAQKSSMVHQSQCL